MRLSNYIVNTSKEIPKEAEIASHQLMLRAGMIDKLTAGVYTFLPLGLKVLRKIEKIIREELDRIGALECLMPVIQPKELWEQSGRWEKMNDLMFRLKDKNEREYCLGPTHEEVITDLFTRIVKSYKDLPVSLYQIQLKYRDEIRPRFGVMRAREFVMKDAYSFHKDKKCLQKTYDDFYKAYTRIFERLGLKFRVVEADSGNIGGDSSHEFMVLAQTGEDDIIYCENCNYASNVEKAKGRFALYDNSEFDLDEKKEIFTPNVKTIEDMEVFFKRSNKNFIKCVLYKNEKSEFFICLIRGDLEINEVKLAHIISGEFAIASEEDLINLAGIGKGSLGPIGIDSKVNIIADISIKNTKNMITGANKKDTHIQGISSDDINIKKYYDIHKVDSTFKCSKCGENLKIERGIEVGHIFQLEDKYSKASKACFTGESGKELFVMMGCYGIGVTRIIGAAIEQNYDDNGIKWSLALAPFLVNIIPVDIKKDEIVLFCDKIYNELLNANIECCYDDRNFRAGFKFKDSDLIGIPYKLIVGNKFLEKGIIEIEERSSNKKYDVDAKEILPFLNERLK
ncbi:MAG: proline--tRNA ligase [Candidatus Muirbacterium halophilum]|nr:proline--tRNA ligase [Candidatus Muirbacterium halophilum]MCK9475331.1 proline--tRNA ligase [Candidatus Muirbacterium halophilum]